MKRKKQAQSQPVWAVTADFCNGAQPPYLQVIDNELDALRHADWLASTHGVMNIEVSGPAYSQPLTKPTEQDILVGEALMDLLEDLRVAPSVKYRINRWCDSKEWE